MKKRVYISFDFDNDNDIKGSFVHQANDPTSPFSFVDKSIQNVVDEKWKKEARNRIKECNCMIVLCGRHTDKAKGVSAEITIAREEKIPYFLIRGRRKGAIKTPLSAKSTDIIHKWKWEEIQRIMQEVK